MSFRTQEVVEACGHLKTRYDGETFDHPEMQYFGATAQLTIDLLGFAKEHIGQVPAPRLP
jgi:hypothetical protein